MNTLFQKITAGFGLTLSLGLASCEQNALLTPNPAGSARLGAEDYLTLPSPNMPQVHKLTKYGDALLTYADNGRLLNAITSSRGSLSIQTDYTYSPGKIRAVTHQGKVVQHDETFTLDASGRCTESVVKGVVSDIYWKYTYNAKGQLWSCQNKNSCVGGIVYSYNADGDMTLATVATSPTDAKDIQFIYGSINSAYILNDEYPIALTLPWMTAHDTYLQIFGKPSKHLVRRISYEPSGIVISPSPRDRFYSYTLDTDGYVTQRVMTPTLGGNVLETTLYEYILTDVTLVP